MMKTITKQPILFTDVPVADLRNSMKQDLNQNIIERLWNKIRDFFLDSDKQKAFKSIHKYINTLSVLNYNSALSPDPNFNIDATSDLDSYLKLDFDSLSPKQKQTTLCCFWNKIASSLPEPYNTTIKHNIIFDKVGENLMIRGTISIVNEVVKTYSLPIEKDDNGYYDFSGLYLAHSNISGKDPDKDIGIDMGNCNCSNVNFEHTYFDDVKFTNANCTNANFNNCRFKKCDLTNMNCTGAILDNAMIYGKEPEMQRPEKDQIITDQKSLGNETKGMILTNCSCVKTTFNWADLSESDCQNVDFSEANLSNTILPDIVRMKGTKLYRTDLFNPILKTEAESTEEKDISPLAKIILDYIESDKNPESLNFEEKSTVIKIKQDIDNFIFYNQHLKKIFNRAMNLQGKISRKKYNEFFKYIQEEAKQDFKHQYKLTKNDYLKKIPLTAQLIAKYKMDDQLDQLLVTREIQDEVKSKIQDKIDELSKNLFNTMTETIENNFDDIFRQQSENMSNYYDFVD
ncbi:T3SS effector pentapeptide repeat protein EspY3 [Escherichia coli]|nr:pentapeptide repeat-containing protein [Escherichia coli]EIH5001090.1 T3SS effector pentapeptide repeat protein EspY3 [Shigella boydii]EGE1764867.1 pentapeptide repeat-containing protein [Escherichia coli]EHQ2583926.1 T3SS effector pentapeptide repeat protein EspY3 [Escherichia coli]EHS4318046.1 T3SS effector pentapeptide repeat protein EspY3 [Escherichia coli]